MAECFVSLFLLLQGIRYLDDRSSFNKVLRPLRSWNSVREGIRLHERNSEEIERKKGGKRKREII